MKQVRVIIEELISQEFNIEVEDDADIAEEIQNRYRSGILVIEQPSLLEASAYYTDDNDYDQIINIG